MTLAPPMHILPETLHNVVQLGAPPPEPATPQARDPLRARHELELAETEPAGTPTVARRHELNPTAKDANRESDFAHRERAVR